MVPIEKLVNHTPEMKHIRFFSVHGNKTVRSMTAMGRWGAHILAQSCKVYLIQEAEVKNPAGMSRHGQQSVLI